MKKQFFALIIFLIANTVAYSQNTSKSDKEGEFEFAQPQDETLKQDQKKLDWFQDMSLGMYLYWTVDAQFGMVNAHSVIGGSKQYLEKYFNELPKTFNPKQFDPEWYARLAKLCGFNYIMICAKNHNGFCMWDTKTTSFNVMNTPYGQDIIGEFIDAIRKYNIPVGIYFSPDDAYFQWQKGKEIRRRGEGYQPKSNKELFNYSAKQLDELIEKYNPDIMCFDSKSDFELPKYVIDKYPHVFITRPIITTPEQNMNEINNNIGAYEAHYTIGNQWQYKATNDENKTGTELINLLVKIRSTGGTLLLAIGGPDADGLLPRDKDGLVRELGLWNFVNGEAVNGIRPWVVTHEDSIYFTSSKDRKTVYAIVTGTHWEKGKRNMITLKSVKITEDTEVEILGQSGNVLEYRPNLDVKAKFWEDDDGLHISAVRAQRLYNNWKWPNPVVLKITNVYATN